MFDPIVGPPDQHSGPAIGHTTEKGDTWHSAVGKINAGFEKVWHALTGGAAVAVEAIDTDARNAFNALRTAHDQLVHDYGNLAQKLAALSHEIEVIHARMDAITAPPDPDGKPATAADPSLDAIAAALSAGA